MPLPQAKGLPDMSSPSPRLLDGGLSSRSRESRHGDLEGRHGDLEGGLSRRDTRPSPQSGGAGPVPPAARRGPVPTRQGGGGRSRGRGWCRIDEATSEGGAAPAQNRPQHAQAKQGGSVLQHPGDAAAARYALRYAGVSYLLQPRRSSVTWSTPHVVYTSQSTCRAGCARRRRRATLRASRRGGDAHAAAWRRRRRRVHRAGPPRRTRLTVGCDPSRALTPPGHPASK